MGSELSIPDVLVIEIMKFDKPIHLLQIRECSKTIKQMIDRCMYFLIPQLTWKQSVFSIWDKKWYDKITKLIWDRNIPLVSLPNGLQSLIFCEKFNYPIEELPNITYLRLGKKFNQPLYLPDSLKVLVFGDNFNQTLHLPSNLEVVVFGEFFNQPVKKLPDTLRELMFGYYFNQSLQDILPVNLKKLVLGYPYNKILHVPSLYIRYGDCFDEPYKNNKVY